ncbi:unnamed protein product [Rodentolepis nana]|uniref:LAGLIDADG_2 domain-containing protein n=1 Tax=Rodentolepis nana TaxID=102285 RepID=A0A0R3T7U3_RODNA|nr:unnamed protein product [Rodentolepis nana]
MTIPPNNFNFTLLDEGEMRRLLGYESKSKRLPICGTLGKKCYATANEGGSLYRLFPSRMEYIAYFLNYYFSSDNTIQDRRMRPALIEYSGLSVVELLDFGRLRLVNTQLWEIISAITTRLPHLKFDINKSVGLYVCRKDKYYAIDATIEELLARVH